MENINQRADEAKEFLKRLWALENEERPGFVIGYTGPELKGGEPVKSALFSTEGRDTVRDRLLDPQKYLDAQLEEIKGQMNFKGDYVPALCPSLGVVSIASAFGCNVKWWENDFPAAEHIIDDAPDKVYELKKPSVTDGELSRVLDYTGYFAEKTDGKLPIRMTDIQGPLDNAALIMGHNNLFMAMNFNPEAVHHLLALITDLTMDFVKEQRRAALESGAEFLASYMQPWIPDGGGINISNDDCVMISPEMHNEFHLPYINRLSEEFGGVFIHSCGNWGHQFSSYDKVRNLRGLEFGASEAPYKEVLEHFGGKTVLACRIGFNQENPFHSMADYVKSIQSAKKTNRGLFINVDVTNGKIGEDWPSTDLNEIYNLIGIE